MTKQVLKTRLIGDSSITIDITCVKMTEKTVTIQTENCEIIRCKIRKSFDGRKYILPFGNYSMAPAFYL